MLALKIFDGENLEKKEREARKIALFCAQQNLGLELANYAGTSFDGLEAEIEKVASKNKVLHLNHNAYSLIGSRKKGLSLLDMFDEEIRLADRLDVSGGFVVHSSDEEESVPSPESAFKTISMLSARTGSRPLFLEKTFESIEWFETFFAMKPPKNVGFCLDTGHTRVWKRIPLSRWVDFTGRLAAAEIPVHVHAHANEGDDDTHIPLMDALRSGMLKQSDWNKGDLEEFSDLFKIVKRAGGLFVLENGMSGAIAHAETFAKSQS